MARVEEEIPFTRLGYSYYNTSPIIRALYAAGETERANALLTDFSEHQKAYVLYLLTFPENKGDLIIDQFIDRITWLEMMLMIAYDNGQMEIARDLDNFFIDNRIPYPSELRQQ